MVTLPKKVKTSPSQFSTNTILDKHGTPNLAEICFSKRNFHDTGHLSFWGSQLAAGSPFTETISSPSKTPATWRNGVVVWSKVISAIKGHGWLDLMVKAPTKATSNHLNNCGWKTILVHFGMASLQGPRLLHSSHCHVGGLLFNIPKQCNTLRFTGNPLDRKQSRSTKSTLFLAALGWCSEWIM